MIALCLQPLEIAALSLGAILSLPVCCRGSPGTGASTVCYARHVCSGTEHGHSMCSMKLSSVKALCMH